MSRFERRGLILVIAVFLYWNSKVEFKGYHNGMCCSSQNLISLKIFFFSNDLCA